jgi:hypothetical protein
MGVEQALLRANFLNSVDMMVLQAFSLYLVLAPSLPQMISVILTRCPRSAADGMRMGPTLAR